MQRSMLDPCFFVDCPCDRVLRYISTMSKAPGDQLVDNAHRSLGRIAGRFGCEDDILATSINVLQLVRVELIRPSVCMASQHYAFLVFVFSLANVRWKMRLTMDSLIGRSTRTSALGTAGSTAASIDDLHHPCSHHDVLPKTTSYLRTLMHQAPSKARWSSAGSILSEYAQPLLRRHSTTASSAHALGMGLEISYMHTSNTSL